MHVDQQYTLLHVISRFPVPGFTKQSPAPVPLLVLPTPNLFRAGAYTARDIKHPARKKRYGHARLGVQNFYESE